MGQGVGALSLRFLRLRLAGLCVALLVGLALLSLGQPPPARAAANPVEQTLPVTAIHIAGVTPSATAAPHAGSAVSADHTTNGSKVFSALPWLGEGLAVAIFILLGFSLLLFPVVMRSARIDRRSRPAFPLARVSAEKQEARLSHVAPERKEPLSREQLQALRDVAASPAAVRLVDGVPVSLPLTAAEPLP